jgi:hypothetical protein
VGGVAALVREQWPVAQASDPVPLEMFAIRGCADQSSAGRKALVTATTPKTLIS